MITTVWRQRNVYDVGLVDIFSGPAFVWAECACAALRLADKPYVLNLHGGNLPSFASSWSKRVSRLLSSAAATVAPSSYLFQSMRRYRSDLRLIPNAVDVAAYKFRLRENAAPNIIWLRAFHRIYNPLLAVEVMNRLTRNFPKARLTMVGPDKGDGSLEETLRRISQLQLSHCISLQGPVPKKSVPEVLSAFDIFINTSSIDNTPVSVVEAMSAGLCVVSTNAGGMPQLVESERNGILVPVADPDAIAAAIRRVITEPGLAPRLSKSAHERTREFDWSIVLPLWIALLKSAARVDNGVAPMSAYHKTPAARDLRPDAALPTRKT
jgi:glycosyltransferase involved in cell wall biosynthesis